jgi:hypothetical protein
VDFCTAFLSFLPFGSYINDSYKLLSELSADEYAQMKLESKLPLIRALAVIIDKNRTGLAINYFANSPGRIEILTERKFFPTHKFLLMLTVLVFVVTTLTVYLLQKDLVNYCPVA